jgi:heme/copper-type cytochrome/quinol oxidase subunit 3
MDSTGRQNNVFFGMMLLLTTEAMFFAGLISAYLVARGNAAVWPPADQPRLPMSVTAINTVILVLSGLSAVVSFRKKSVRLMIIAPVPFCPASSTITSTSGRPVAASTWASTSAVISMR